MVCVKHLLEYAQTLLVLGPSIVKMMQTCFRFWRSAYEPPLLLGLLNRCNSMADCERPKLRRAGILCAGNCSKVQTRLGLGDSCPPCSNGMSTERVV